jgi:hypothetical protein
MFSSSEERRVRLLKDPARFRKVKQRRVLTLAEVLRTKKLGQTHNLGAKLSRLFNEGNCALEIAISVGTCGHLDESDGELSGVLHTQKLTQLRLPVQATSKQGGA